MIDKLAVSVVDHLRNYMQTNEYYIRLMPDGRPAAGAGEWFVSVFPSSWTFPEIQDRKLEEEYGITCTVTKRISANPWTDVGATQYVSDSQSIVNIIRQIILAVHNNYTIMSNIQYEMADDYPIGTALKAQNVDPSPRVVDGLWFWTDDIEPSEYELRNRYGLVMSVTFGGAIRVQDNTNADYD